MRLLQIFIIENLLVSFFSMLYLLLIKKLKNSIPANKDLAHKGFSPGRIFTSLIGIKVKMDRGPEFEKLGSKER